MRGMIVALVFLAIIALATGVTNNIMADDEDQGNIFDRLAAEIDDAVENVTEGASQEEAELQALGEVTFIPTTFDQRIQNFAGNIGVQGADVAEGINDAVEDVAEGIDNTMENDANAATTEDLVGVIAVVIVGVVVIVAVAVRAGFPIATVIVIAGVILVIVAVAAFIAQMAAVITQIVTVGAIVVGILAVAFIFIVIAALN